MPQPVWIEIDSYVEKFERGRAADTSLEVRSCLPPPDHPLWLDVLRELVRVEGELRITEGSKPQGQDVRTAYPELMPEEVLGRLSPCHRFIIGKRFEGFDIPRIAAVSGRSIRSVERILREFRRELASAFGAEES